MNLIFFCLWQTPGHIFVWISLLALLHFELVRFVISLPELRCHKCLKSGQFDCICVFAVDLYDAYWAGISLGYYYGGQSRATSVGLARVGLGLASYLPHLTVFSGLTRLWLYVMFVSLCLFHTPFCSGEVQASLAYDPQRLYALA